MGKPDHYSRYCITYRSRRHSSLRLYEKNANVFYELGVAHALGKEVILIAQHESDIPFDVVHYRYIVYHNDAEGLGKLARMIAGRVKTLRMA